MEDPISTIVGLIAVALLVLANGFFVATEFALVSVRRTRIQQLAAEGNKRAAGVLDRLTHLDTYIAATQLGITISSLALGWIGEPAVAVVVHDIVAHLPFSIGDTTTHAISFVLAFSFVTALHIVIGELAPKSLALQRPEDTSLAVSSWIHGFLVIFRPVIFGLNWVGNQVVKLFGIEPAGGHAMVQSAEELLISISASHEAGLVNETAHDIVGRAFAFNENQARHVMVPRTEVVAIPVDASLDTVMQVASDTSHTRLPIYEQDTDHIVGIVKVKRLMPVFLAQVEARAIESQQRMQVNGKGNLAVLPGIDTLPPIEAFDLRDFMVEPMLIPETLAAIEVLNRMRDNSVQMAVVIDEFGGTAGIVTLQDIVSHLVGRVQDEDDEHDGNGTTDDGVLHLEGLTGLVELRDQYDIDLLDEEYDVETLGGYVFFVLGRPAILGDEVVAPGGHRFVVEELDGLRVSRVTVLPPESGEQSDLTLAAAGIVDTK
ncbi:MAG TPA: hemolysin family protein [Thermomicrobiales bacterium]|nr:hemolysin family protein [Thermomicrobiales bacterium]